jgi:hypothetical protein
MATTQDPALKAAIIRLIEHTMNNGSDPERGYRFDIPIAAALGGEISNWEIVVTRKPKS